MQQSARFSVAMGMYAVLALVAWRILTGPFRAAVWVFLAGLAFKTWIAMYRKS